MLKKTFVSIVLMFFCVQIVNAQENSIGFAVGTSIEGVSILDGQIVCTTEDGYKLCDESYSSDIQGVISLEPSIEFELDQTEGIYPVVSVGSTYVLVQGSDDPIQTGDYITSTETPGIGRKAQRSGYVLGSALEPYEETNPDAIKNLLVAISIKPVVLSEQPGVNLIELIREGIDSSFLSPLASLRYFLAALAAVASVGFGLYYFARIAKSGVEALGRNPLAQKSIQLGIIFNVILTIGIMAAGLFIAYIVLRF